MKIGVQQAPDDPRIYNRPDANGNVPPMSGFFLKGMRAELEYLPAPTSRKWRKGFMAIALSQHHIETAMALKAQEGWHDIRFVPAS